MKETENKEAGSMDKEMKRRIASQLELRKPQRLYCCHDAEKPCRECMSNITGDVSGILAVLKEAAKRIRENPKHDGDEIVADAGNRQKRSALEVRAEDIELEAMVKKHAELCSCAKKGARIMKSGKRIEELKKVPIGGVDG